MRTAHSLPCGVFLSRGVLCQREGSLSGGSVSERTPPPMNRMIDTCENITLPQTTFAFGNDKYKSVVDPGFLRGALTPERDTPTHDLAKFCRNCMKIKEFGRRELR